MPVDKPLRTQLSLCLVGTFIIPKVLLTDLVLGWSLFAAAMTTNQNLRSELISRFTTGRPPLLYAGVFPVVLW
jgi:hypothetical protein